MNHERRRKAKKTKKELQMGLGFEEKYLCAGRCRRENNAIDTVG